MPWGEGPGALPPMRAADGAALVRLAAAARVDQVVGADELEREATQDAWHTFVDLMRDVADTAAELEEADRHALAQEVDRAIAALRDRRVRVLAGAAGVAMYVAVLPFSDRRDLRAMFAGG